MSFLKKLLGKEEEQIKSYEGFWNWFSINASTFYNVVKTDKNVQENFITKIGSKLDQIRPGYFYLAGMLNNEIAELIITADGKIKNLVFVEEIVQAAPTIKGWKFTAHKPALDIKDVNIKMYGHDFNQSKLHFIPNYNSKYLDDIDLTIIHEDFTTENEDTLTNGSYIFLDNFLGEINFVTSIDHLAITGKDQVKGEFIPMSKLKDYLIWREKEFIEKYEGVRHDTENDAYSAFEAELENGNALMAVMNTSLLSWDSKPSHPWILIIEVKFSNGINGMPDESTYALLEEVENELLKELKDFEGYLNIGRETANDLRTIYFACKEFKKSSKIANTVLGKYSDQLELSYNIYKDKYWMTFSRFSKASTI